MAIKNVLFPNRVPVNKYMLMIQPGVGAPVFTAIGGLEEELDAVELPDRTTRSGGRSKQVEFDVTQPMHHDVDVAAMEAWYLLGKQSLPGYLKQGTLIHQDEYGLPRKRYTLVNLWVKKRVHSDLEMDNDGEMSTITWTMQCDRIQPQ